MEAGRRTEHEPDLSQLLSCSVAVRAHHLAELGRPDPPRGSCQLKVLHTPPAAPRDRLRSRWPLALSARGDSLLDLDHEIGKAGTCDVGTKTAKSGLDGGAAARRTYLERDVGVAFRLHFGGGLLRVCSTRQLHAGAGTSLVLT